MARALFAQLPCRFAVASFPAAGLSGRGRGMAEFHARWFSTLAESLGFPIHRVAFSGELVFIIEKKGTWRTRA